MRREDHILAQLIESGLCRKQRVMDQVSGMKLELNQQSLWNFGSNDYLGLSQSTAIQETFSNALDRYGLGSGASRLVSGTRAIHDEVETILAQGKSADSALTFSSGYAVAVGSIPAIVGKGDVVILDKLAHACLIDGAKLSGATIRVFPHNQMDVLEKMLKTLRQKQADSSILIVTESVFSMDGDLCLLEELIALKERYGAMLFLDEAHGFGVLGNTGMGYAEACGVASKVDFQMGTFSKALGLAGGYLACNRSWREVLWNRARSMVFSTAPPPALLAAVKTSIQWVQGIEGNLARQRLQEHIHHLKPHHPSPIIPILIGSNEQVLEISQYLEQSGFYVPAIRYPTVPRGKARLRISLSSVHEKDMIEKLKDVLQNWALL